MRCVEPDFEPRAFSVWTPKALACIGRLPAATLEDRSIEIALRRRKLGEHIEHHPPRPVTRVGAHPTPCC